MSSSEHHDTRSMACLTSHGSHTGVHFRAHREAARTSNHGGDCGGGHRDLQRRGPGALYKCWACTVRGGAALCPIQTAGLPRRPRAHDGRCGSLQGRSSGKEIVDGITDSPQERFSERTGSQTKARLQKGQDIRKVS